MPSKPASSRSLSILVVIVLLSFIGPRVSAAQAGPLDDTVWSLTGTATVRVGAISRTVPISQTLTLNSDRTYLLHNEGTSEPDEVGAWFEYRGQLQMFTQNILEGLEAFEEVLSADAGEPVRITPLKSTGRVKFDSRTGQLLVQSRGQIAAMLQTSNRTVIISTSTRLTGVPAP